MSKEQVWSKADVWQQPPLTQDTPQLPHSRNLPAVWQPQRRSCSVYSTAEQAAHLKGGFNFATTYARRLLLQLLLLLFLLLSIKQDPILVIPSAL
jgi:hypothetical protein